MKRSDASVSLNVKESNARAMLLKAQAEQDLPLGGGKRAHASDDGR